MNRTDELETLAIAREVLERYLANQPTRLERLVVAIIRSRWETLSVKSDEIAESIMAHAHALNVLFDDKDDKSMQRPVATAESIMAYVARDLENPIEKAGF